MPSEESCVLLTSGVCWGWSADAGVGLQGRGRGVLQPLEAAAPRGQHRSGEQRGPAGPALWGDGDGPPGEQSHRDSHRPAFGSGGRAGWLVTGRLLVRSSAPPSWVLRCPWVRPLTLTAPDQLAVALPGWFLHRCVIVFEWVNVRQYRKVLWVATG